MSKIQPPLEKYKCWNFIKSVDKDGYGKFYYKGKTQRAHRVMAQWHLPAYSEYLLVCHTCDNPSCVNPRHLFMGTALDNQRDSKLKGRSKGPPKKTHCSRGHLYTLDTTMFLSRGRRQCRLCKTILWKRQNLKRKEKLAKST